MAMYSAKEMKAKMGGRKKIREIELKNDKQVKLWIPKNEFYYERKHFNFQMVDKFKNASVKAIACINSEKQVGECPICSHIQELWGKYRATKDKAEQKQITNQINRLSADVYYVNAIDIADKTYSCYSLRLTAAMFKSIMKVICPDDGEEIDINKVIWTIKKTENNGNIRYVILDDTEHEKIEKLIRNTDKLCNRPESEGGYIDLDKAYNRHLTIDEYYKKLFGDSDDVDVNADDEDEVSTPKQSSKKSSKPSVTISDDDLSLDELDDLDEEPKQVKKSKVAKDDDLDDLEVPKETKVGSKKQVNEEDDDLDDLDDLDEKPKQVKKSKNIELEEDDELDDLDDLDEKPKQVKKSKVAKDDDLDDLDDLDEEPKKPVKQNKPTKTIKEEIEDDLDDLELDEVPF